MKWFFSTVVDFLFPIFRQRWQSLAPLLTEQDCREIERFFSSCNEK